MLKINIAEDGMAVTQVTIEFDGSVVDKIALTPDVMRALAEYIALNGRK